MNFLVLLACVFCAFAQQWEKLSDGPWSKREGLMGTVFNDQIWMSGGRTVYGLGFCNDVWKSDNGTEWEKVVAVAPWEIRAYHIMVAKNDTLFIMGGQNFGGFFNDVWSSKNGAMWRRVGSAAPWHPRAGLAAVVFNGQLVVTGGSWQASPISQRSFFSDVWTSVDGLVWRLLTEAAGYVPCSGPRLVVLGSVLLLIGGENGFDEKFQFRQVWASEPNNARVWRSYGEPPFSNRSGHGVVVYQNAVFVVAGYLNKHDLWMSYGAKPQTWKQLSNFVFNCGAPQCGRYDFWSLVHRDRLVIFGGSGAQSTFGPPMYAETWALSLAPAPLSEDDAERSAAQIEK